MWFTQLEFPIFFLVVLAATWMVSTRASRNAILLIASYYFYAYWDIRFCSLLALSTVVDFAVAKSIDESNDKAIRRRWLMLSLVVNLGMLGSVSYTHLTLPTKA